MVAPVHGRTSSAYLDLRFVHFGYLVQLTGPALGLLLLFLAFLLLKRPLNRGLLRSEFGQGLSLLLDVLGILPVVPIR